MLSFLRGKPIAIIKGGKYNNKILHLSEEEQKCCNQCSLKCLESKYKCCTNCKGGCFDCIVNKPFDMLGGDYVRKQKKKMSKNDMNILKRSLQLNIEPYEEDLLQIFNNAKKETEEKSKKEFKIFDDGIIQPLPNFNKTERCYIAGPTDSGKSYYAKKYLTQLRKVYPQKPIYIFSDVEQDPELDVIPNITRFKIDDSLLNKKPIKPEALSNSIVVFDDIDSIQNPKVSKIIQTLRDSLLRRGRHEDISVIVTSHLMSNYKDTRIILNECNSITFFARSGATDAIKYTLSKYGGLSSAQIQTAMDLPSRWVTLYKCYPQYILYEKGVYLL